MASFIRACKSLLENEYLNAYSRSGDNKTLINADKYDKILNSNDNSMALWARSSSGERIVDMMLPGVRRTLARLADEGPNHTRTHDGISFRFVQRSCLPFVSTKKVC